MPTQKRGLYSFIYAVFGDALDVNVVSSRFFMVQINDFIKLIEELEVLREKELYEKSTHFHLLKENYYLFCDELNKLYQKEQEKSYNQYIVPFIEKYSFLTKFSSLDIIKKTHFETYHSLFLSYLFDSEKSMNGEKVLLDFLNELEQTTEDIGIIKKSISLNEYKIDVEHTITKERTKKKSLIGKRIDLLITNKNRDWCITIENKIDSDVHSDFKGRTQLDCYKLYCDENFKGKPVLYILLSHKENKIFISDKWHYANYYQIFRILINNYTDDDIIRDYLKTLYSLLFSNKQTRDNSLLETYIFYKQVILKINQSWSK